MGPATGLILPKSKRSMSAAVDVVVICALEASSTSNSMDSPGAIRSTAPSELSQP
jgi:hypothetical protein